jgi:proteasome lid subunit RPN8/RPN11
MFDRRIIDAAKTHAIRDCPREAVGVIVGDRYLPQENISPDAAKTFELPVDAWLKHGRIQGVLHSHPNGNDYPSAADMASQMATAVPWGIIICDAERATEPIWFGDQTPRPPLTGPERYFRHGVTDCYSLIRAWYREARSIVIPDFARDWEWWNQQKQGSAEHQNLYVEGFSVAGFRRIPEYEVRPGDVFLAAIRSKNPCHGGIYLGGSGDMILHHLTSGKPVDRSRLAVREPGIRYLKYVTHWLRHKDMPV